MKHWFVWKNEASVEFLNRWILGLSLGDLARNQKKGDFASPLRSIASMIESDAIMSFKYWRVAFSLATRQFNLFRFSRKLVTVLLEFLSQFSQVKIFVTFLGNFWMAIYALFPCLLCKLGSSIQRRQKGRGKDQYSDSHGNKPDHPVERLHWGYLSSLFWIEMQGGYTCVPGRGKWSRGSPLCKPESEGIFLWLNDFI